MACLICFMLKAANAACIVANDAELAGLIQTRQGLHEIGDVLPAHFAPAEVAPCIALHRRRDISLGIAACSIARRVLEKCRVGFPSLDGLDGPIVECKDQPALHLGLLADAGLSNHRMQRVHDHHFVEAGAKVWESSNFVSTIRRTRLHKVGVNPCMDGLELLSFLGPPSWVFATAPRKTPLTHASFGTCRPVSGSSDRNTTNWAVSPSPLRSRSTSRTCHSDPWVAALSTASKHASWVSCQLLALLWRDPSLRMAFRARARDEEHDTPTWCAPGLEGSWLC